MAKSKTVHRLVIHLDTRVGLEAVLLNWHECLPTSRRHEWLRCLLMQGFRDECQALNGAPESGTHRPAMTFSHGVAGKTPQPVVVQATVAATVTRPAPKVADKPFATLSNVIGPG